MQHTPIQTSALCSLPPIKNDPKKGPVGSYPKSENIRVLPSSHPYALPAEYSKVPEQQGLYLFSSTFFHPGVLTRSWKQGKEYNSSSVSQQAEGLLCLIYRRGTLTQRLIKHHLNKANFPANSEPQGQECRLFRCHSQPSISCTPVPLTQMDRQLCASCSTQQIWSSAWLVYSSSLCPNADKFSFLLSLPGEE